MPLGTAVQPVMLESRRPVILAGQPEAVEITGADILPVVEQYAELEGRLRRAHEIGLVDAEQPVVIDERRDRAFADADGSDRLGFDQSDLNPRPQRARDRRRTHPPPRSPARAPPAPHVPSLV